MLLRIAPTLGIGIVALLLSSAVMATNAVGHDQVSRDRIAGATPVAHRVSVLASDHVSAVENLLVTSQDTVLDRAVLDTVAAHVTSSRRALVTLKSSIGSARVILASNSLDRAWGGETENNHELAARINAEKRQVQSDILTMASDTTAIHVAVAEWKAEQVRIAEAKAEAARVAAAQAAAAAAAAAETAREAAAAAQTHGRSSVASVGTKDSIARDVFARFGFTAYSFDTGQSRGHWGATDLNRRVIYLQLSLIPQNKVAWVAKHEFGHIVQAETYGGYSATIAHFGSVAAMEADADAFASSH